MNEYTVGHVFVIYDSDENSKVTGMIIVFTVHRDSKGNNVGGTRVVLCKSNIFRLRKSIKQTGVQN